jgi:hypothetical protein
VDKNIITRALTLSPTYTHEILMYMCESGERVSHYLRETHSRKCISGRPLYPPDFIVIKSDICPHPDVLPATLLRNVFWSGTLAATAGVRTHSYFSPCMHLGFRGATTSAFDRTTYLRNDGVKLLNALTFGPNGPDLKERLVCDDVCNRRAFLEETVAELIFFALQQQTCNTIS